MEPFRDFLISVTTVLICLTFRLSAKSAALLTTGAVEIVAESFSFAVTAGETD